MSEWQPIETAPHDERVRILVSPSGMYWPEIATWCEGVGWVHADEYTRIADITHWMPLPEPPK